MTLPDIDYGDAVRLGIIVPSGNVIAEPQIRAMLPRGVSPLFTRLALRGSSDAELRRMMAGVEDAAGLLSDAGVDRIVFHCTAVTTMSPESGPEIQSRIQAATGVQAIVTSDALAAAFHALDVRRVVLLTPYIAAVHQREIAWLAHLGLRVEQDHALGIDTNAEMGRLQPADLLAWAESHATASADALFLSCTALRSAEIIEVLEQRIGCPVVTSNQAMVWYALRSAGVPCVRDGWGALMRHDAHAFRVAPDGDRG